MHSDFYRPKFQPHHPEDFSYISKKGQHILPHYDDERIPMAAYQRHIQQRVYSMLVAEERVRARTMYGVVEENLS